MNYYIIIEDGCKNLYYYWLEFSNTDLTKVESIKDMTNNNYLILSGGGTPNYYKVIRNSCNDLNDSGRDDIVLVVIVDSEEYSESEKLRDMNNYFSSNSLLCNHKIIIQFFCIETWLLANYSIKHKNQKNIKLKKYIRYFDVRKLDPEDLMASFSFNTRAQFAKSYLVETLKNIYGEIEYYEKRYNLCSTRTYFESMVKRFNEKSHIKSFSNFIKFFK